MAVTCMSDMSGGVQEEGEEISLARRRSGGVCRFFAEVKDLVECGEELSDDDAPGASNAPAVAVAQEKVAVSSDPRIEDLKLYIGRRPFREGHGSASFLWR